MTELSRPGAGRRDIERFLRVDHAGERAAQQIYRGQLAILRNHASGPEIQHMMEQEVEHLEAFENLLNERRVRPSLLDPVWGAAGFALGAVTAAMGPKAAMACTIAVEEVIGEHYADQADRLGDDEAELRGTISKFRDDELEHRDIAVEHRGREAMFYAALKTVILKNFVGKNLHFFFYNQSILMKFAIWYHLHLFHDTLTLNPLQYYVRIFQVLQLCLMMLSLAEKLLRRKCLKYLVQTCCMNFSQFQLLF